MNIQPLGEQIIIKTLPPDRIGSIIIPDTAKSITIKGESSGETPNTVSFVEAEVIAVGPGVRSKGDPKLVYDQNAALQRLFFDRQAEVDFDGLFNRANAIRDTRIPPLVKPGDRILYHPAVQTFDREITDLMNGDGSSSSKYFIIREGSVLAVLEKESE